MPIATAAQTQQSPPIPALPTRPGAATGAQSAPAVTGAAQGAAQGTQTEAQRVAADVRQAANDARDAIRAAVGEQVTAPVGDPITLVPPPQSNSGIPREVIPIIEMSLIFVVVLVIAYPIARAIGRVIEKRGTSGLVKATDLTPQLQQLQASVDTMAIELERISESQRFTAKLMKERAVSLPGGPSREG